MQGFNRYYPPDFDPQKHVTLNTYHGKHALGDRARKIDKGILITRFELPFNIWCSTCNNHIGMGVRYNAEKKKVGNYYTTPIYSFRCKCHLCDGWFEIQTDPKNTAYVVTSGARKQEQDWDPEENGGFAAHETNAGPSTAPDAFTSVEKTTAAEQNLTNVVKPRLTSLTDLSARRNADPYTLSSNLRRTFRVAKKEEKRVREEEDSLRSKFSLPTDLKLIREDDVREEAREQWERERREWELEEDVRRKKLESQHGGLRITGATASSSSGSTKRGKTLSAPALANDRSSHSKRTVSSHLTSSKSNKTPHASTLLASSVLRNSLKRKDPFLSSATLGERQSSTGRLSAKSIGVVAKRS